MKGLVIAGTSSGSGKTVATLVVLRALENIGEDPQLAKVGPDFIDPSHHRALTGKPSRTLDIWLEGKDGMIENYHRGQGSICIAEGVMGLYDGDRTSTAKVAEVLGLPVVLVVDGSAGMESVAATALGFREYADHLGLDLEIAGVISQKTRPGRHERGIKDGLPDDLTYFGRIPPMDDLEIPERHLGLFMGNQATISEEKLDRAGREIDVESIIDAAKEPEARGGNSPVEFGSRDDVKIGMAYDSAFNFVYPGTREKLDEAELRSFSPLNGDPLPDVDGVYLPGGYPELYPGRLSESPTLAELAEKSREGLPVFGECGGMMVMGEELKTGAGEVHEMTGILPVEVEMVDELQALGYVELEGKVDSAVCRRGARLRGHEFHYSGIEIGRNPEFAFDVSRGTGMDGSHEGLMRYNSLGTYTHFHGESGAFDRFINRLKGR